MKTQKRICLKCGKEYQGRGEYFCSRKCMGESRIKWRTCKTCLIRFPSTGKGKQFCSSKCYGQFLKGKPLSKKTKEKLSEANKGKHFSPVTEFKKQKHCDRGGKSVRSWRRKAIWTLEKKYGISWDEMYLPENPIVHHLDGNPKNFEFKNLCVMCRSDHARNHYDNKINRFGG